MQTSGQPQLHPGAGEKCEPRHRPTESESALSPNPHRTPVPTETGGTPLEGQHDVEEAIRLGFRTPGS